MPRTLERSPAEPQTRRRDPPPASEPATIAPRALAPAALLRLQATAGNASVAGMLARCPDCGGACEEGANPALAAAAQCASAVAPVDPAEAPERIAAATSPAELAALALGLKQAAEQREVEATGPAVATLARQPTGGGAGGSRASGGFCKPYSYLEMFQAAEDKAFLLGFLPAASTGMFQSTEVGNLWLEYLTTAAPATKTFRGPASTIVRGFETAAVMLEAHRNLFNAAVNQLKAAPPAIAPVGDTRIPVASLLPSTDLAIDFSNPFDIPGHIAGGVGSGDASVDSRDVAGDLIVRRQVDLSGATTGYEVVSDFRYHCHDTVDFCPGQAGSGLEQNLTIPLSRLEATGMAHDVPFDVHYAPAPLTATLAPGDLPAATGPADVRDPERERDLPGRDPDRRDSRDLRTPADRRDVTVR